ncbi:MAG: hypothetical protein PVI66_15540 [Candidatus Aminicenantes bacterium]|jgi:hypothetical protein
MAEKTKDFEISVAEVVDYLRITGGFAPALREVIERKITADAAKKKGLKVTTPKLQKASDAFRVAHGLHKSSDTKKWLKSNGISEEALEEFLETNLLISMFKDQLEKKTSKTKYLSSPSIKELVRDSIYRDWLKNQLK